MSGIEAALQDEAFVFLVTLGIVLWSLLCVMAALRNGGKSLEKTLLMFACQFFLVMASFFQIAIAETIISRLMGVAVFAAAIISIFMRRDNFQLSRYCIAVGAVLATCAVLLF